MQDKIDVSVIRNGLGWTRRRMAQEAGVDVSTISRWERDKVEPSGPAKVILSRLARRARPALSQEESAA